jgi:uncharacterized paraquat-inducible protein A
MARCPKCQTPVTLPKGKKALDCEACGSHLKLQREGLRNYGSQLLFVFLLLLLVLSGVGPVFAIVLAAAAGGGLWYWLGNFSLAVARE